LRLRLRLLRADTPFVQSAWAQPNPTEGAPSAFCQLPIDPTGTPETLTFFPRVPCSARESRRAWTLMKASIHGARHSLWRSRLTRQEKRLGCSPGNSPRIVPSINWSSYPSGSPVERRRKDTSLAPDPPPSNRSMEGNSCDRSGDAGRTETLVTACLSSTPETSTKRVIGGRAGAWSARVVGAGQPHMQRCIASRALRDVVVVVPISEEGRSTS